MRLPQRHWHPIARWVGLPVASTTTSSQAVPQGAKGGFIPEVSSSGYCVPAPFVYSSPALVLPRLLHNHPSAVSGHPKQTALPAQFTTPSEVLAAAERDANAENWVDVVAIIDSGNIRAVYDQSDGPARGSEELTINSLDHLGLVVFNHTAYFIADSGAASRYLQLPPSTVARIAQKWIEVPATDPLFKSLAAGLGLQSLLTNTLPSGPLTESAPTTIDGHVVVGISGGVPSSEGGKGSCTLYVSTGPHPLPVALRATGSGMPNRVDFSQWGLPQIIHVPRQAILASSVELHST